MSERLKERRDAAKLTLGQVVAYGGVDVSKQYISQIETEKRTPNWGLLGRLAEIYDTSADYILGLTNDPTPASRRDEWTPAAIAAAQLINTAPPEKQEGAPPWLTGKMPGREIRCLPHAPTPG